LLPQVATQASAYPCLKAVECRASACDPIVLEPSFKVGSQLFYNLREAVPTRSLCHFPDPLLEPLGAFPHGGAGCIQVVDKAAYDAMVNAFRAEAQKENFAGLLIDFDHFSLDEKLKSEAAGWITALEARVQTADGRLQTSDSYNAGNLTANDANLANSGAGLWGKIRWSDLGEDCVKGGRYRFLLPVWSRSDCEDLGPSTGSGQAMQRLRPVRLLNAAVTNDPNLKGMRPLSNRKTADGRR